LNAQIFSRPSRHDRISTLSATTSRSARYLQNLQIQGEYLPGNTRQNNSTSGFGLDFSASLGIITRAWKLTEGVDSGMTFGAPRLRIFAGFTYAIGKSLSSLTMNR